MRVLSALVLMLALSGCENRSAAVKLLTDSCGKGNTYTISVTKGVFSNSVTTSCSFVVE